MARDIVGNIEWPGDAANARAAQYWEQAAKLRRIADNGYVAGRERDGLLALAQQHEQLAETLEGRA